MRRFEARSDTRVCAIAQGERRESRVEGSVRQNIDRRPNPSRPTPEIFILDDLTLGYPDIIWCAQCAGLDRKGAVSRTLWYDERAPEGKTKPEGLQKWQSAMLCMAAGHFCNSVPPDDFWICRSSSAVEQWFCKPLVGGSIPLSGS